MSEASLNQSRVRRTRPGFWITGVLKLAAAVVALATGSMATAGTDPWQPFDAAGGDWAAPIVSGDFLYSPLGGVVEVWNLADPGNPAAVGRTGDAPVDGGIADAVIRGTHLYVSWSNYPGNGGVSVYSLADPAHPLHVAEVTDYTANAIKRPGALVVSGSRLYLLDSETGIYVADLTGGPVPVFTHALETFGAFSDAVIAGTRLYVNGSNFFGQALVEIFDLTAPNAPISLGVGSLPGGLSKRVVLAPPLAIGIGFGVEIVDFSDPANPVPRDSEETAPIFAAVTQNNRLYAFGSESVQTFDLTNPDDIQLVNTLAVEAIGARHAATTPGGFVAVTQTDHLRFFSAAAPSAPTLLATRSPAGGADARDIAFLPGHAVIAQNAYGLSVHAPDDLAPLARFDASLEPALQARAFEAMDVENNRAYLAAWGYGVVIADLTDPLDPVELGKYEFAFASAIDAVGSIVYAGKSTDGGELRILDASNPAQITQLGTLPASKIRGLVARGTRVFLADELVFDTGGLRIIDASTPSAPVQLGQYVGCESAGGVDANAAGTVVYLACFDGAMHIVDTSNPAAPVELGRHQTPEEFNAGHAVRIVGTRAFYAHEFGVDVIDVANPAAPTLVQRMSTGYPVVNVRVSPERKVYAFTSLGGVLVFEDTMMFADGFEGL
jgi:hypothetical protein